tara:strand:+ start:57 stop:446 length:390 start_codon:yes stop_codon:yes gene_type:complete
VYIRECSNLREVESMFKDEISKHKININKLQNGNNLIELFQVNDKFTLDHAIDLMDHIIDSKPSPQLLEYENKIKDLTNELKMKNMQIENLNMKLISMILLLKNNMNNVSSDIKSFVGSVCDFLGVMKN